MRAILFFSAMFVVIGLAADPSSAQLSPGKLSEAHADLDSSRACLQCHSTGKGVTAELCLACHGLLGERISAGAGLHAREGYRRCETCHIEHHGRDFELIWWGEAGVEGLHEGEQTEYFDHGETGYSLDGAHGSGLDCRSCHQSSRIAEPERLTAAGKDLDLTFLGLATDCAFCHQDPHRGQMTSRNCAECHGEDTWRPAPGFDHDRTDFPLDGRHARVDCAGCHATETDSEGEWVRYRGTATACADCHQDPHRGRLGRDCAACHVTADWQQVDRARFNHDLTRFPLRGLHARVDCAGCHRDQGRSFRVAGLESCATCHADVHAGQFRDRAGGGACSDCHDERGFIPSRFDLDDHAGTRFPLEAAHRAVPCASCHVQVATAELVARGVAGATDSAPKAARIFRIDATGCADCHRDPHAGSADAFLGDAGCRTCHDGDDWQVSGDVARFDHGATGFPLEGAHRIVGCAECHSVTLAPVPGDVVTSAPVPGDEVLLSFEGAPTACRDCHQDPHLGQFERSGALAACRDCHSMEGWTPSLFNHDDSAFPLEGKHANAECGACHKPEIADGREIVRYRPLQTACSGCHQAQPHEHKAHVSGADLGRAGNPAPKGRKRVALGLSPGWGGFLE